MSNVKLTIGIPTIPNRNRRYLEPLFSKLMGQVGNEKDVEIIALMDNKMMSIGRKKTLLFSMASGKYACLIDDDDDVTDDFVATLRSVINDQLDVDVICYDQEADINGKKWLVKSNLNHNRKHPFDQLQVDQHGNPVPCKRPPWQWCAWKTSFIKNIPFGDSNWAEDAAFTLAAVEAAKSQLVLDRVLCKYRYSPSVSEAPQQNITPNQMNRVQL
jgi:hypothetical protein